MRFELKDETICGMVSSLDSGLFSMLCETSHVTIDIDGFSMDCPLLPPESSMSEL